MLTAGAPGFAVRSGAPSQSVRKPTIVVPMPSTSALPKKMSVDWFLRYVSAVPTFTAPAYTTSNLRYAWQITPKFSVYAVGRNLHEKTHAEFSDGANGRFGIERAVLIGMRWAR